MGCVGVGAGAAGLTIMSATVDMYPKEQLTETTGL